MNLTQITTLTAAVGAATFGGVLFAFSTFVMPGLNAAPPSAAIQTMQQINRAAPRSLLAFDMVATLVLCLAVGVLALVGVPTAEGPARLLLLVGAALYVLSFVITAIYHIPLNDAFDGVAAGGPGAAQAWHDYARPWELWNHVRAAAALGGAVAMIAGLLVRSG